MHKGRPAVNCDGAPSFFEAQRKSQVCFQGGAAEEATRPQKTPSKATSAPLLSPQDFKRLEALASLTPPQLVEAAKFLTRISGTEKDLTSLSQVAPVKPPATGLAATRPVAGDGDTSLVGAGKKKKRSKTPSSRRARSTVQPKSAFQVVPLKQQPFKPLVIKPPSPQAFFRQLLAAAAASRAPRVIPVSLPVVLDGSTNQGFDLGPAAPPCASTHALVHSCRVHPCRVHPGRARPCHSRPSKDTWAPPCATPCPCPCRVRPCRGRPCRGHPGCSSPSTAPASGFARFFFFSRCARLLHGGGQPSH